MKSNIAKFSDFELYLFSTGLFATLKTRSEKNRGINLPAKSTGTPPFYPRLFTLRLFYPQY